MRRIFALFIAAVLLCGCTALPPEATNPSPIAGGEAVGTRGNLWYLPNAAVEAQQVTQLLGTPDGLLLCGGGAELTLILLSEAELTPVTQTTLEASEGAYVQCLENGIGIADPENGTVTILNFQLETVEQYRMEAAEAAWLLSLDGGTLYSISTQDGITARGLRNEETTLLVDAGCLLSMYALTEDTATLVRLGEDLREYWYELDLRNGGLTAASASAAIVAGWKLQPLTDGRYLYRSGRSMNIYGSDGSFLSTCRLDGSEENAAGYELVWSERWQVYFFIDHYEGTGRLMLWDPSVAANGKDIALTLEDAAAEDTLPQELYDRAAELSRRFGVDLRIADQCQLDYGTFQSRSFDEVQRVEAALDIVEQALSRYPEGYLDQLRYGGIQRVRIELVADLKPDADADVSSTAEAFSRDRTFEYLVVLDGDALNETNIHHELSHIADKRVLLNAAVREDALFSAEAWMELQPEGFAYADSYTDVSADVKAFYGSGYFARNYACVSASEDKATMMECAIMGRSDIYNANPHLMPKLEYYCACIRDSFDTAGWPEVTPWEQLLAK